MSSAGRSISQKHRYDIPHHSTDELSCIPLSVRFATTSHGGKPTRKAHINNLYNTVFWALIQKGGQTTTEAHATLRGTVSSTKHEMLYSQFGINYNEISDMFKKGSVIVREIVKSSDEHEKSEPPMPPTACSETQAEQGDENSERPAAFDPSTSIQAPSPFTDEGDKAPQAPDPPGPKRSKAKKKVKLETTIEVLHCDIIGDEFWLARPHLLENRS
ncbi:hypothetical protein AZE42_09534 [Rhizopogon vesiculosus]|uniref:Thg1 C-terminal domain-containing protein n=1 Tax=Rhizopogon vesiculosus TaxID=180088 RepID=A0A1J8PPS3_9AGAM|nr:hypothetical protein AZE42_09534 [Rhizopogon vesiculosus]